MTRCGSERLLKLYFEQNVFGDTCSRLPGTRKELNFDDSLGLCLLENQVGFVSLFYIQEEIMAFAFRV